MLWAQDVLNLLDLSGGCGNLLGIKLYFENMVLLCVQIKHESGTERIKTFLLKPTSYIHHTN